MGVRFVAEELKMDVREKLVELPIEDALLILREEHRQRTDGYTTYLEHGGKGDPAEEVSIDALSMAISALEKTKWISVKDKMPEKDGQYLVFTTKYFTPDHIDEIDHKDGIEISSYSKRFGFLSKNGLHTKYWCEMPQPPKGE